MQHKCSHNVEYLEILYLEERAIDCFKRPGLIKNENLYQEGDTQPISISYVCGHQRFFLLFLEDELGLD